MLKTNYHTHTMLCNHAEGMPEDYVQEAIALGYEEIGITDHNPIPVEFLGGQAFLENWCHRNMSYNVYRNIYLPIMKEIKEKYKNEIRIYSGLECEYLPEHSEYYENLRKDLDYLNLGIHFFPHQGKILSSYAHVSHKTIGAYASIAKTAMNSGLFKIFVHPDLFLFDYKDEQGKRTFDQHCLDASRSIIETAILNDVYLEINVNGIENSKRFRNSEEWLYPNYEFWKVVREYPEAKVVIGVDAHELKALSSDKIRLVEEMVEKIGLHVCTKIEL